APRSPVNPSVTLSVATTLPRASLMANSFFVPQRPPSRQFSLSSTLRDGAMVE
ncbi:unnamed protein product, partial [Ectocarpus sp. 12 AP-2014]